MWFFQFDIFISQTLQKLAKFYGRTRSPDVKNFQFLFSQFRNNLSTMQH